MRSDRITRALASDDFILAAESGRGDAPLPPSAEAGSCEKYICCHRTLGRVGGYSSLGWLEDMELSPFK